MNRGLDLVEGFIGGFIGADSLKKFGDMTYLSTLEVFMRIVDSYMFGSIDWVNTNIYHKLM